MSRRGKVTKVNQDCASKESKILKFSRQKHHRRSNLIDTLFMYASSFPQKITVSTLWENHKCINDILMQLTAIESEMKVPLRNRTRESVAHLQCWAKENGVEMNNVQITEVLGFDYGLVATNDVTEGSIVVSVPKRLMITVDSIKDSPLETLYNEDVVLQQLPNVALAIFILVEKFRTDKPSFWLPYLQALPNTYTTCVYFTMDDLNELKGSPALEYSLKMCKNIARQYAYFWRIFQKNTDEASNILRDVFTFEQYRWAVSTIMTRQNYIPCADCIPVNVIIPVWDFCNHANNERRDDTEPSTTYDVENECCVCVAPKHFSKGEQISIFYGERCNADFLVHNGFVYPQNHHDVVKVKFGISKSDSCSLRLALLNKLKLPPSGEYSIKADERDPIHCSVLAFVRIFKMSQGQLNEWLQRDDAADVLLSPVPSMGVDFDRSVLHYLQTRIVILLKAYPTTIKEDQELLARDDLSTTRRLAITHRMTEKNILNKAVDYCKLKILELDTSEIKVQ